MNRYAFAFGLLLSATFSASALACQGLSVVLDEHFKDLDSGWDKPDEKLTYDSSGAVIKPPQGRGYFAFNRHYTSDGTSLCATAAWPTTGVKPTEADGDVGVVFWAKDYTNYYVATISNQGDFEIDRYVANAGQIINKAPKDSFLAFVNKDPGGKNEIEVQLFGSKGTLFVNGKKVTDFSGQPPPGSGFVGLFANNYKNDSGGTALTFTFPAFRIATYP